MFSIPGFALMRALGQQRGVTDPDALTRLSVIGGAVGFSPIGILVGDSLIRRELDSQTPPPVTPPPAETAEVPPVVGVPADEATAILTQRKFTTIVFVPDSTSPAEEGLVINQDPDSGQTLPITTTIKLTISTREEGESGDAGVHERTALIAAKVSAISEEVKNALPAVTPHVAAAVVAIKKAVDQVQTELEKPVQLVATQQPDAAAATTTSTEKQSKKTT